RRHDAMITPAVMAAALEPSPLPRGISLVMARSTAGSVRFARDATESAVCQMRLSSAFEMRAASRPSQRIASRAAGEKRQVRYNLRAIPRESKPGPRLALDAGTRRVVADVNLPLSNPPFCGARPGPFWFTFAGRALYSESAGCFHPVIPKEGVMMTDCDSTMREDVSAAAEPPDSGISSASR